MTPKEKAKELVDKFGNLKIYIDIEPRTISEEIKYVDNDLSKQCALIAVEEIIKDRERLKDALFYDLNYWLKVKNEIEEL